MVEKITNSEVELMASDEGRQKESQERKRVGMKLSQLTPEILEEIINIYSKVCGGEMVGLPKGIRLSMIEKHLKSHDVSEWRFGSRLMWEGKKDKNAKLFIRREKFIYGADGKPIDAIISFSFDPNIVEGEEAKEMRKNFKVSVEDFLLKRGSNVEI